MSSSNGQTVLHLVKSPKSQSHTCNKYGILVSFFAIQDAVRNSVCHTATVIANSFMHTGTTSDQFLR